MSDSLSILIVDDNQSMASTLSDILRLKGFNAYEAYSGVAALKVLRTHNVDVLLTDFRMPDMNGVELFRKTTKKHPELTTILITAYIDDNIVQQGLKEGMRTVLNKPLDMDLLIQLLSTINRNINHIPLFLTPNY